MTNTDQQPTRQAIAVRDRSAPGKVTGKLRTALDAMVWDGLPRKLAAEAAQISEHGLYKALRRPPVRAYYLGQLEVLRTSERARNIHTLAAVRDQTDNQMARVNAVKALEQLEDQPHTAARQQQAPGFVIQIVNAMPPLSGQQRTIEAKPLISQGQVRDEATALPEQGDAHD